MLRAGVVANEPPLASRDPVSPVVHPKRLQPCLTLRE